ncbi:MAG: IS66 family transposase [Oligoflexus sp.]
MDNLPKDPAVLKQLLAIANNRIAHLEELLRLFNHKRFAPQSESYSNQQLLFNEAEADVEAEARPVKPYLRSKPKRKPLPESFPRIEKISELSEEEKACTCGQTMKEMGEAVSEQIDIVPAKVQVIRHIRKKYACPCCDGSIKQAGMPKQAIPKSNASAGTLAFVAASKYCDGLPLHRQETILKRLGVDLPRSTLASWMIKSGELVTPLINMMKDTIIESKVVHIDETTLQVLKEKGRKATTKSYAWVMARGSPEKPLVIFHYEPTRSSEVPIRLLSGFKGFLISDGYKGYDKIASSDGITHCGCWDHARRRFFEAEKSSKSVVAAQGLSLIRELYLIEREFKDLSAIDKVQKRKTDSLAIIKKLKTYLDANIDQITPSSLTGKALQYMASEWSKLTRFLDNPDVPLSNALAENAIRPFTIGRKNWLFSASTNGAEASMNLYSLVETAKANGLEPTITCDLSSLIFR